MGLRSWLQQGAHFNSGEYRFDTSTTTSGTTTFGPLLLGISVIMESAHVMPTLSLLDVKPSVERQVAAELSSVELLSYQSGRGGGDSGNEVSGFTACHIGVWEV